MTCKLLLTGPHDKPPAPITIDAHDRPSTPSARSRARSSRRPLEPAHGRGAARRPTSLRRAHRDPVRHRPEHPDRPTSTARTRRHRPIDALPGAPDATRLRPHGRWPRPRLGPPPARRLGQSRRKRCGTPAPPHVRHRPRGALVLPDLRGGRGPLPKPRETGCSDRGPGTTGTKGPPSPVRISWGWRPEPA